MTTISTFPLTTTRLTQIANTACTSALSTATSYHHESTATWNNAIINSILTALIAETTPETDPDYPEEDSRYKFAVNSTIIQHLSDARPAVEDQQGKVEEGGKVGRRGMHSASGAYWNNERDGLWSFKYEGGESKGMDIVVSVMWIGV